MTVKVAKRDILWSGQTLVRVPGRHRRWISARNRLAAVIERDGASYVRLFHQEFVELITGPESEQWQAANRELSRVALASIALLKEQRKRDHA